jgi:hypothetical protein
VGPVGGADVVGADVVDGGAEVVGAAEVVVSDGDGFRVVGTYVGDGECPSCGAVPSRLAGGGNCSTGRPSMSRFITASHVSVG